MTCQFHQKLLWDYLVLQLNLEQIHLLRIFSGWVNFDESVTDFDATVTVLILCEEFASEEVSLDEELKASIWSFTS